jgi:hypothetical protein
MLSILRVVDDPAAKLVSGVETWVASAGIAFFVSCRDG